MSSSYIWCKKNLNKQCLRLKVIKILLEQCILIRIINFNKMWLLTGRRTSGPIVNCLMGLTDVELSNVICIRLGKKSVASNYNTFKK